MNPRGHYGKPRIGNDTADAIRMITRTIEPRSVFYDPEAFKVSPETARHVRDSDWAGRTPILVASAIAIVGIGVIGLKRGVKFM